MREREKRERVGRGGERKKDGRQKEEEKEERDFFLNAGF